MFKDLNIRAHKRDYEWIHTHVQEKFNKFIASVLHRFKVN